MFFGRRQNGACERSRLAFSEYVDRRLPERERRVVDAHLAGCSACSAELAGLRATVAALASLPRVASPRNFTVGAAAIVTPRISPLYFAFRNAAATAAALLVLVVGLGLLNGQSVALSPVASRGPAASPNYADAEREAAAPAIAAAPLAATAPASADATGSPKAPPVAPAARAAAAPAQAPAAAPQSAPPTVAESAPSGLAPSAPQPAGDSAASLDAKASAPATVIGQSTASASSRGSTTEGARVEKSQPEFSRWPLREVQIGLAAAVIVLAALALSIRRRST